MTYPDPFPPTEDRPRPPPAPPSWEGVFFACAAGFPSFSHVIVLGTPVSAMPPTRVIAVAHCVTYPGGSVDARACEHLLGPGVEWLTAVTGDTTFVSLVLLPDTADRYGCAHTGAVGAGSREGMA